MYLDFFGLHEKPFSIAPDPRYLYMTDQHREALAHLSYGVGDEGGFIVLTGEIGTGKTTICRSLLNQLPEDVDIAFIINPRLSAVEVLKSICDDLGIIYQDGASIRELTYSLNQFLLESYARGRNTILIIDEAQNLEDDVLEQLRLLTNLETSEKKLLQLILLGQPELNDKLAQHSLRQLAQRVTARFHLMPLSYAEMQSYIAHRLYVAGFRGDVFSRQALKHIYKQSQGIPRLINVICDRAMLGAYTRNLFVIEYPLVVEACREVLPDLGKRQGKSALQELIASPPFRYGLIALAAVSLLFAALYLFSKQDFYDDVLPQIIPDRSQDFATIETLQFTPSPVANNGVPAFYSEV